MSLEQRITKHEGKLAQLSPETHEYMSLKSYISALKDALPKKEINLHVDTGPTCEGCQ